MGWEGYIYYNGNLSHVVFILGNSSHAGVLIPRSIRSKGFYHKGFILGL